MNIEMSWKKHLAPILESLEMQKLQAFLEEEVDSGRGVYPPLDQVFEAYNKNPLKQVRVVIIGQDPYHGPGQAHGQSFSVLPGVKIPPSLRNIFKEIQEDLGHKPPASGHLKSWSEQGVFLLNQVLTVSPGKAGSHQKKGWEEFTDRTIEVLNQEREGLIFLLWGAPAQKKGRIIDTDKHIVLMAPHPSPLSAYRGFFGCGHFSKVNEILKKKGELPINWELPPS